MARKSSGKAAGNKEKQGKIVYLTNIECAPLAAWNALD
jgi:hypothetical protein